MGFELTLVAFVGSKFLSKVTEVEDMGGSYE